uniref:RING-type domain-containing protein n=1 Tax=Neolamprologus brichardi TaxID=32507 RepID=A0A3Q4GX95_NEOBR
HFRVYQFLCCICLDVFTDPVSIPCGHNFCKNCITEYWDMNVTCQCPMCKETFYTIPQLRVNTLLSEMVAQFKCEVQQKVSSSSSEQQAAKPGEVPCDICTGTRLKALKSCLVCQESYCQTHLEPHLTKKGLKRHQLIDAVENLEGRMCKKHDKPLELFCNTNHTCDKYDGKKAELEKTEAEIQQMIQKRRQKIQEIKESVKMIKGAETKEKQAEGLIKDLEQEISELMKRRSEVDVTLDPDTANSKLILSDDRKQVHHGDVKKKLPDNPERISYCVNVLGKQSFSSGRFYFEVQVKSHCVLRMVSGLCG